MHDSRKALALFLFLLSFSAGARSEEANPLLTLEDLFTERTYAGEFAPDVRWSEDGRSYTVAETSESSPKHQDLVRYETATGRREVVVPSGQLVPAGQSDPLAIHGYSFSGDGSHLLIMTNAQKVWRRRTRGDYWLLRLKDGALRRLGGERAAPSTLMFARFSPDSRRVGYVRERNIYVESVAGDEPLQLTHDGSETVINGTFDWVHEEELSLRDGFRFSPDSRRIAYWQLDTSGVGLFRMLDNSAGLYPRLITFGYPKAGTTNAASRIGVVSVEGGETTWLVDHDDARQHYLARMEWAQSSREILVQHLNRLQNALTVMLGDVEQGRYRTVVVEKDEAWVDAVDDWRLLKGDRGFVWLSERDGWRHAYLVSRDGTEVRLLTPGEMDVIFVVSVDEEKGFLYFIASPDEPSERYLYRAPLDGSGKVERLTPPESRGYNSYRIAPGSDWALHTVSSFGAAPKSEIVRLPEHRSVRVVTDNAELNERLAALSQGEHRFFRLEIEDDVRLDGWEMRPPDFDPEKKYPVFFYVYGEPWGQTVQNRWTGSFHLWHLMLTQQGYLVMSVDNRGTAAPRGRDWRKSLHKRTGTLSSQDIAAATKQIGGWDYVDAGRVGIWGWSGGGTLTLNMLFRYPDLIHTGIAVGAATDQRFYDTIYTERYQGLPDENPEVYREAAPIHFAENLEGNLLLIHGTADDNVHYQGIEALIDKLVASNKHFTLMAYPNRSHNLSEGEGTRRHFYELMTRYLHQHLPPGPR